MGIQGLLPLLKDIQVSTSVSAYKGLAVGIDVYCWLHKGAYACAMDLALGKENKSYVNYCMRRVEMLISHNITPILVFDGGHLPAKALTEKKRRDEKKKHKAAAIAALNEGNDKGAYEKFQRCIDINPEMASQVILECYRLNVQCIVAPYEADAQLAYLMKEGITQLTISEDSDLLLYGCNKVMYKMSADGDGLVVDLDNLSSVKTVQLASFTLEKFRHMCMLSGCDYLPSIKGMGLMNSFKAIRRFPNAFQCIKSLKCNPKYSVPKDYAENFRKSDLVFKYQLVFDIRTQTLVRLNDVEELDKFENAEKDYAGPMLDAEKGIQIALGNIDPISGKTLACLPNFASGVISQRSSGWDCPPPPDTSTSFKFRGDRPKATVINTALEDNQKSNEEITRIVTDPLVNDAPTNSIPSLQASKSLKRILDEDEPGPTREEKIRRLYGEESPTVSSSAVFEGAEKDYGKPDEEDLLFAPTATLKGKYNLFSKKTSTFKNSFKLKVDKNEPAKIVRSKFFSNKIVDEKENDVRVDAAVQHLNGVHDKSPIVSPRQGSFLDYLDKNNVRGYEVRPPLLLSKSSPKRSKQAKIDKISPSKKSKRRNIFAVQKGEEAFPETLNTDYNGYKNVKLNKDYCNGDDNGNIDFNVNIPLDESSPKTKLKPFEMKQDHLPSQCSVDPKKETKTEFVELRVQEDPTTFEETKSEGGKNLPNLHNRESILRHFRYESKSENRTSKTNEKDGDDRTAGRTKPTENGNISVIIDSDDSDTDAHVLETTSYDITEQSLKNEQSDLLLNTENVGEITTDHASSVERVEKWLHHVDSSDVEEKKSKTEMVLSGTAEIVSAGCAEQTMTTIELDENIIVVNECKEEKKSDKEFKSQPELDEEPLPTHLLYRSDAVDEKVDSLKVAPVTDREDEVIPSCSDEDVSIVKSLSFPITAKTKGKHVALGKCRPIGLSKKRKQTPSTTNSDGKLKQITFERFAFNRKSIS